MTDLTEKDFTDLEKNHYDAYMFLLRMSLQNELSRLKNVRPADVKHFAWAKKRIDELQSLYEKN